jgi:hypothetical protein
MKVQGEDIRRDVILDVRLHQRRYAVLFNVVFSGSYGDIFLRLNEFLFETLCVEYIYCVRKLA